MGLDILWIPRAHRTCHILESGRRRTILLTQNSRLPQHLCPHQATPRILPPRFRELRLRQLPGAHATMLMPRIGGALGDTPPVAEQHDDIRAQQAMHHGRREAHVRAHEDDRHIGCRNPMLTAVVLVDTDRPSFRGDAPLQRRTVNDAPGRVHQGSLLDDPGRGKPRSAGLSHAAERIPTDHTRMSGRNLVNGGKPAGDRQRLTNCFARVGEPLC